MPLKDILMERFKAKTRVVENPVRASVGTTAQILLHNNPNRLAWVIVNTHATQVLYVGFTDQITSATAIRVDPAGGHASMVWDEDFEPTGWAIWGVGDAADTTIYSYEVVEY